MLSHSRVRATAHKRQLALNVHNLPRLALRCSTKEVGIPFPQTAAILPTIVSTGLTLLLLWTPVSAQAAGLGGSGASLFDKPSTTADAKSTLEGSPANLQKFFEVLNKPNPSVAEMEKARLEVNFRRSVDGRVYARNDKGKWFAFKLDMKVAGMILLQDSDDFCYFIPPLPGIGQVDLSSDAVVAWLLADPNWFESAVPIQYETRKGKLQQLRLTEQQFSMAESIMSGTEAYPQEGQSE